MLVSVKNIKRMFEESQIWEIESINEKIQHGQHEYENFMKNQIYSHGLIQFLYRIYILSDYQSFKDFVTDFIIEYKEGK